MLNAGNNTAVQSPPNHSVGNKAFRSQVIAYTRAIKDLHGWRTIVGRTGSIVELGGLFDNGDGNILPGQQKPQELASWARTHD